MRTDVTVSNEQPGPLDGFRQGIEASSRQARLWALTRVHRELKVIGTVGPSLTEPQLELLRQAVEILMNLELSLCEEGIESRVYDPVGEKARELADVTSVLPIVRDLPDSVGVANARRGLGRAADQLSAELEALLRMPEDRR